MAKKNIHWKTCPLLLGKYEGSNSNPGVSEFIKIVWSEIPQVKNGYHLRRLGSKRRNSKSAGYKCPREFSSHCPCINSDTSGGV